MISKLFTLLLPLTLGLAAAQQPASVAQLDQLVEAHHTVNHFMGNVVLMQNGKTIYSKSVGFANVEHQVPNQANTVFEVGSITKSFTGAAILKLQEQGKLKVTDPLSKFLPDYPNGENITLHHLLTHTSGIYNFTNLPNFVEMQKQKLSVDQLIDHIKTLNPDFAPGTRFNYSNSGYILLGKVIG